MNIKIYPLGDQWGLFINEIYEVVFDTLYEVKKHMTKLKTAAAVVWRVQQLAEPMDNAADVEQEYFDVVAVAGAYTNADLEALGITAEQLESCVTLLQNFNKLMTGDPGDVPTVSVYCTTVNEVRRVETS